MAANDHEVDKILECVGLGKWQVYQVVWLCLFYFTWANIALGIVIIGYVPDFACSPITNHTADQDGTNVTFEFNKQCEITDVSTNTSRRCTNGFIYGEPKGVSIVSEWDLVCGQSFLSELSQTVLTIGQSIGSIIFTPLADRFGRKHLFIWTHALLLAVSTATSFVPNITLFIVLRGFAGAFLSGAGMVSWVVTLELFVPKHRTKVALITNIFWGICACSLPAIAYMMHGLSWRYVNLTISIFVFVWIGQIFLVDESFRWLIANGRRKEALKLITKAAKKNQTDSSIIANLISRYFTHDTSTTTEKSPIPVADEFSTVDGNTDGDKECEKSVLNVTAGTSAEDSAVSPLAIIEHPILRKVFLILAFTWFTNSLTYFGLYMVSSAMPGDRKLNLFFNTCMEVLAALILFPVLLRFGRRIVCSLLHALTGVSLLLATILYAVKGGTIISVIQICFTALAKFGISGTFMVIFMYTPELFPTNIRSLGTGLTAAASRIGGIIAPFSVTVARSLPWVPGCVFAGCCLGVAVLSIFLPETFNRDLPQTLQDLESWKKQKKKITEN